MKAKKDFLEYIKEVKNIITPLEIPDNGLSDIQSQIEHAELIVPVVGGFSAGKSTLINSFLGTGILPTAVTPETALATELRYSETDYIEAVTASGGIERHEISEFGSLKDNAQNFTNLRLFLNNDKLKAIQPLVLVDMPGFDAPIENHNRAILTYLERGVFFVFLTSVDDGNITLSMRREIENLERFSKGFAFCISKTNLRAPDDVAAVKEKIADQLADYFDYEGEIALLDMDGGENLNKILQTIDPEELFSSLFLDTLRDNNVALTQSINLKTATLKKDGGGGGRYRFGIARCAGETRSPKKQRIVGNRASVFRQQDQCHCGKSGAGIVDEKDSSGRIGHAESTCLCQRIKRIGQKQPAQPSAEQLSGCRRTDSAGFRQRDAHGVERGRQQFAA